MAINLSEYHQRRNALSDQEVLEDLKQKKEELDQVFKVIKPSFQGSMVRIAVLGCADKRFIPGHKEMFKNFLEKEIDMSTLDITLEHLQGAENIVKHDCTQPLPGKPYDITYGHILLKFMPPEKQWQVLTNSFNQLNPKGMAIHLMNSGGKTVPTLFVPEGFFNIPLKEFEKRLEKMGIEYTQLEVESGKDLEKKMTALVLRK